MTRSTIDGYPRANDDAPRGDDASLGQLRSYHLAQTAPAVRIRTSTPVDDAPRLAALPLTSLQSSAPVEAPTHAAPRTSGIAPGTGPVTTFETWFGSVDAPLFGSVHLPSSGFARGAAVLCSPLGKEHITTYRGVRQLAEKLAASGLLVLRFDYRGHGDSSGDQSHPDAAETWVDSVHQAVDYVRSAGATEITLVGLRAGALLSAAAAVDLAPLTSIVLWDPVLSGRSYVREQVALYKMTIGEDDPSDPRVSILGAAFAPETVAALGKMKVNADALRVATDNVLCIARDENLDSRPVRTLVETTGADLITAVRHDAFVNPPSFVFSVPSDTVDAISGWVSARHGNSYLPVSPRSWVTARVASTCTGEGIFETIEYRGPDNLLSISTCTGSICDNDALVVLHATASEHRIGPVRLWVEAARSLASHGVGTVRFDKRGTGDSGTVAHNESTPSMSPTLREDVDHVMESIDTDPSRIMHVGMCSGSWHSAYAAEKYGAASVLLMNTVNWSLRKRRPPVKAATIDAMNSSVADGVFKIARSVRNVLRGAQKAIPYSAWRALGAMGIITNSPEPMLQSLSKNNIRTTVLLSPSDHEWFVGGRGERALTRLRAYDRAPEVAVFDRGDHSLYHRDLRLTMSAALIGSAVDVFDLELAPRTPAVPIGVERI